MATAIREVIAIDPFGPGRAWRAVTFSDATTQDAVTNVLDNSLDAIRTLLAIEDHEAGDLNSDDTGQPSVIGNRYLVLSAEPGKPVDLCVRCNLSRRQVRAAFLMLKIEADVQIREIFVSALARREMEAAAKVEEMEKRAAAGPGLFVPSHLAQGKRH